MNAAMMWFDNDPKTSLSAKVERAVDYYKHKYGRDPNLCLIHPTMLPPDGELHCVITVRPYRPVLPGHLWVGVEDKE